MPLQFFADVSLFKKSTVLFVFSLYYLVFCIFCILFIKTNTNTFL